VHCVTWIATAAITATAALGVTPGAPVAESAGPAPGLRLVAAQDDITVTENPSQPVTVDPGIWVAAVGSDFRLNVQRPSLAQPVSVTQIIDTSPGTTTSRVLPSDLLDGWSGLSDFFRMEIKNARGLTIDSTTLPFCPDSANAQRAIPDSQGTSPYPQMCGTLDPFELGTVWGIERGWAVDPAQSQTWPDLTLAPGKYRIELSVAAPYQRLFGIPAKLAAAEVTVTVKAGIVSHPWSMRRQAEQSFLAVPTLADPPPPALPQLVAEPAWEIGTAHSDGRDLLDFAATVWVSGNSPLDVEGFRVPGSASMTAYQFFWRDGRIIGKANVGTMGFANFNHWHFQQFATYQLLNSSRDLVVRSQKEGFCIAATDSIDLLLPHATWQPSSIGLGGQCGVPSALWVQEYLPVGWGDTYSQTIPGQAFDITDLPNGLYYIEVAANPLGALHELSTAADISYREVILGGSPGNRTVCAPAVDGIDPEC
jgi:hypothetical protein